MVAPIRNIAFRVRDLSRNIAWHSLFIRNLLIRPKVSELDLETLRSGL